MLVRENVSSVASGAVSHSLTQTAIWLYKKRLMVHPCVGSVTNLLRTEEENEWILHCLSMSTNDYSIMSKSCMTTFSCHRPGLDFFIGPAEHSFPVMTNGTPRNPFCYTMAFVG